MFTSPFGPEVAFVLLSRAENNLHYPGLAIELALLPNTASSARRRDFLLGRAAAHMALKNIGIINPEPVLRGLGREPLWPIGIVGSISHTKDWAVAAVAKRESHRAIGIDLELIRPIGRYDILDRICSSHEKNWVEAQKDQRQQRLTMLFSAKESLFKAFYLPYKVSLGFRDVELRWDQEKDQFSAILLRQVGANYPANQKFEVGCLMHKSYVFTWTLLAA